MNKIYFLWFPRMFLIYFAHCNFLHRSHENFTSEICKFTNMWQIDCIFHICERKLWNRSFRGTWIAKSSNRVANLFCILIERWIMDSLCFCNCSSKFGFCCRCIAQIIKRYRNIFNIFLVYFFAFFYFAIIRSIENLLLYKLLFLSLHFIKLFSSWIFASLSFSFILFHSLSFSFSCSFLK
jgi:hypothetical protein